MQRRLTALLISLMLLLVPLCRATFAEETGEGQTAETAEATQEKDYSQLTPEGLDCQSAILIDADTGDVLFTKDDKIRMHPASTTKIMTLLLAVESGIPLDREIAIPQAAADIPSGSSLVPVYPGETMTFGDLLLGVSINSGNDGANAIAVLVSGTVGNFVSLMNARAAEIGCTGTHFANAHGYTQDDHYTTAYDLALITRVAMQNETFREIAGTVSATISTKERGSFEIRSSHMLMRSDSDYYYKYCIGVKTGTTDAAGKCFVGAAEKDGATIISVVLNCSTEAKRWIDTAYLFEYGWTCYDTYTLEQMYSIASPQIASFVVSNAAEDDAEGGQLRLEIAQLSESSYLRMVERDNADALPNEVREFIAGSRMEITHSMTAPISKGEIMGTYTYTDATTGEVVTATLVAGRDVEERVVKTGLSEYLQEHVPFLKILDNTLFKVLLILLAAILVLIIVLVLSRRAQKQRIRRQMVERRRQEYLRQQRMRRARGQASPRHGAQAGSRPPQHRQPGADARHRSAPRGSERPR